MSFASRTTLILGLLLGVASAPLAGCANRTATFAVTRPAMLNAAAVGNTMTVGGIAAPTGSPTDVQAAAEIVADLTNRITNSLNRSIHLVGAGGGVVITGAVLLNTYGETIEQSNRTCSRQVPDGRDANGFQRYRTENYTCTDLRRVGTAQVRLQFTLTRGSDQQVLFDQTYEDSNRVVTTGIVSPYERRDPDAINAMGVLQNVRAGLVEHFARVILPWQESVTVEFEDCDGDQRCRQGTEAVQRSQLEAAEPLFTAVIGEFQNATVPVPPNAAERVGEAFYNRGLTRAYMGQYARAVADFTRAMQLRPDESDWHQELENAQQMSRDQEALRQQGAVSNQTQNVQQAGTP